MKWIIPASMAKDKDGRRIGGKGYSLASMARNGFNIPETLLIARDLYDEFVSLTGLRERIL
ncbi:MAG: PEP/pyruvate-binding domain-containing protein, partial [Desulfobacterales bacterium]